MNIAAVFCIAAAVFFLKEAVRICRSPEFKRDLEHLREHRRLRKAERANVSRPFDGKRQQLGANGQSQ